MNEPKHSDPYDSAGRVLIALMIACSWISAIAVALEAGC